MLERILPIIYDFQVIDDLIDLGLQSIWSKSKGPNIAEITIKAVEILSSLVLDYSGEEIAIFIFPN